MIKKLIILIVVVAAVGATHPYITIDDGVGSFSGEEQLFAAYALQQARVHNSSALDKLMVRARHVRSVTVAKSSTYGCERIELGPHTIGVNRAYTATVEAYTFFGQPYQTVIVGCDGTVGALQGTGLR